MRLLQKALTFDDVLLVPAHSDVLPRDVNLVTKLTRGLTINIPVISAAMDTVTEAPLAIAIAQVGGIGIIHKNMPIEIQAAQVAQVKRFESGVVKDPIVISPDMTVRKVLELTRRHNISGLPVVEGRKVVGIVTNRDFRFETNLDQPIRNIMTPREKLVTAREGVSQADALALLHKHRLEKLLVVDENFELRGLITVKDITKTTEHPNANTDNQERLCVGAAVGV
ncbi:MAG: IMP dehydrogenase, partial [Nitrosomonas sp.]|nr:IMP dehydrogenase [Nitrosomonas sp.]